ncbi:MAG: penicillin-binding transpeptidase domain-containing protein, partial [Acutalibacteraceae bacterium]
APAYFETNKERRIVAKGLSDILDMEYSDVLEMTKKKSYYVSVKRQIESDVRDKILKFADEIEEDYDITSVISLQDDYKRYYPYNDLASSVIGFTGSDEQGLTGIEYQYDDYLTGTPGRLVTARNSNGTEMPYDYEQNIEAKDGNSLVLTIDETIQAIMEKYMKQNIKEMKIYNRGCAIMMNVNTGEILGMATVGGFDLNNPYEIVGKRVKKEINSIKNEKKKEKATSEALLSQWRNKAVSDTYYPGSVFKIITTAIGLQENVISTKSNFYCSGSVNLYGQNIHCHQRAGHGSQTLQQAVINSCNPAFTQIGQKIGTEKFWEYYQAFGYSEKTGIDLPGESEDIFFSEDGSMGPVDLAVSSFGQNFSITPIQMITAISAAVNGGNLVQPHIVKQILDSDGNVVENIGTTVKRKVVSQDVSDTINKILEANAKKGGTKCGYVAGYRVAGKTGTSEKKTDSNDDGVEDYIASFAGYAPADDPEYAMLILFDTPTGANYYGSVVSAPVFSKIMEEVFPYLEMETEYTSDELKNIDTVTGTYTGLSVIDAKKNVESDGLTYTVKGTGKKVVAQMPEAGNKIPKSGTVVLYTDKDSTTKTVTVPDLTNYSMSEANSVASAYGLNVSVKGATTTVGATVTEQDIEPGKEVS